MSVEAGADPSPQTSGAALSLWIDELKALGRMAAPLGFVIFLGRSARAAKLRTIVPPLVGKNDDCASTQRAASLRLALG